MRQITKFVSFDNREFDTEAACRAYETENANARLVGLTAEQIGLAMTVYLVPVDQRDLDALGLAEALEAVGTAIARSRREANEFRRNRKPKGEAPQISTNPENRVEPDDHPSVEAMRPDDDRAAPIDYVAASTHGRINGVPDDGAALIPDWTDPSRDGFTVRTGEAFAEACE